MKNSVRGLLLVTGGMIAGALISASLAAPERAARTVLPLDEIRPVSYTHLTLPTIA